MSFKLALVQPLAHQPPEDGRNVEDAIRYVEQAAIQGAEVVAFPETYPGPWTMPMSFEPMEAMREVARRCGVWVQFGTLEPVDEGTKKAYNLAVLVDPGGEVAGVYRRTFPPGPWIYTGGQYWDFDYTPASDFPVFETPHGEVGLAICSEVYMPEVARTLCLRGAELLFMPAGIDKHRLWATWRNLIWSRAIENLAVVVTTQNLMGKRDRGLAMIAYPEEVVFETTLPGMFVVDIELNRVRELRSQRDGVDSSLHNAAKAGVLSQWQRPELRDTLLSR
jgi:predicted amidohydrolase